MRCCATRRQVAKKCGRIAPTAYRSAEQEQSLSGSRHESQIHERAYRNKPLTEAQALSNTEKSRVRARVEHVFGAMENDMGSIFLRSIGAARAKVGGLDELDVQPQAH